MKLLSLHKHGSSVRECFGPEFQQQRHLVDRSDNKGTITDQTIATDGHTLKNLDIGANDRAQPPRFRGVGCSDLSCQITPFISSEMSINYGFYFINHHFQLGNRIFRIRWNTQAMVLIYHELMTSS